MKKNIKVLMLCDSINTTTGNAKVGRYLLKGLKKRGFDVSNLAMGADQAEFEFEGIRMLPITQKGFDSRSVEGFLYKLDTYLKREKPDFMIVLGDKIHYQGIGIGNLNKDFLKKIGCKLIFWETVDSEVILCSESMEKSNFLRENIYKSMSHVVTTSHYGKKVLENEFIKVDKVIWEFVDSELFKPVSPAKKIELRKRYRFAKDECILLTSGRNMRRKNPELLIESVYPLLIKYPKTRLFCVIPDYMAGDDKNLVDFIDRNMTSKFNGRNLLNEQKIIFVSQGGKALKLMDGVSDDEIINFHQLSDIFLFSSSNEGFNLNYGEAMACGTPYIGINNTTIPELTDDCKFGFIAEGSCRHHIGHGIAVTTTTVDEFRNKIEEVIKLFPFMQLEPEKPIEPIYNGKKPVKPLKKDFKNEEEFSKAFMEWEHDVKFFNEQVELAKKAHIVWEKEMEDYKVKLEDYRSKLPAYEKKLAEWNRMKDKNRSYIKEKLNPATMIIEWSNFLESVYDESQSKERKKFLKKRCNDSSKDHDKNFLCIGFEEDRK